MEELQPQDIEGLLQELEEEDSTQESLPQEVEELLHILESGSAPLDRQEAAEQLGNVESSSPRIVRALIAAYESDSFAGVSAAAAKSLRAPVHQEYMDRHPDLMEVTERALGQRSGSERQRPRPDTGSGPQDGPLGSGKAAEYHTSGEPQSLSYYTGVALGTLFVRVRSSFRKRFTSYTPGELKARDAQVGRKGRPVPEGDRGSDCPACGAWNPAGSETCDECGTALAGAEV